MVRINILKSIDRAVLLMWLMMVSTLVVGQQNSSSSRYVYNPLYINPAYAGYYENPLLNFSAQGQLGGVAGAPRGAAFSIHGRALSPRTGLGGTFINDQIGVTSTNSVYLSYAYKLFSRNTNSYTSWEFSESTLSFGLQGGFTFYNEDLADLGVNNDPNFDQNINRLVPNFGVGIYFSRQNFYAGLSSPQLLNGSPQNNINIVRHFYLNSGVNFEMGPTTMLILSGLLRMEPGAPVQLDINTSVLLKDQLSFGAGYRSNSTVNVMVGIHLSEKLRMSYFYDYSVHKSSVLGVSIHEFMVEYRIRGMGQSDCPPN